MWILALLVIVILTIALLYGAYKKKIYMINKINSEYGGKPRDFYKDFDMSFVKKYYKTRTENEENSECIDELTWNDLDMDSVFKRTNYTSTTLGEAYLYYKYRKIEYNSKKFEDIETLINSFMKNKKLRSNTKLNLMKVGKISDDKFIDFIYSPNFNKIRGYYKYPLLSLGLSLSIITIFINFNIGIGLTIFFMCTNILVYQSAKSYLEENFNVMIYLLNNVKLSEKLSKIKDNDFIIFREQFKDILTKFSKIKKIKLYSNMLSKNNGGILSDIEIITDYIKMFFMIDIISYQSISKILEKNKDYLYSICDLVAQVDFSLSIAYYRESVDEYVNPEFTEDNIMVIENIYHPLIDNPIKNSITIDNNIIFTGSNASGKSTFIKAVALNCIMTQSLNTALCSKYKARFSKVITSMAIKDNILEGDSYFIAEIKSLKRLIDSLSNSKIPVLAFIDEILKGTNTVERISASAAILKHAITTNARLLVATHDIELTEIIHSGYDNYHFRETVTDNDVYFDYKIKFGPSTTRNAIKLLKVMDFNSDIVKDSNDIYDSFIKSKKWLKL